MLHKKRVVFFVIRNVKMGLLHDLSISFIYIVREHSPQCNVHKNRYLGGVPVHGLDLILDHERIVLRKIDVRDDDICW
jgi:hypothetical protein